MEVKSIININDKVYTDFADQFGTIFNSIQWLSIYGPQLEVMGIFHDNQLIAIFNHWKTKKFTFQLYRNPPMMPHNGFAMRTKASNASNLLSEKKEIIELLSNYYKSDSKNMVELSFPPEIIDMQPFVWGNYSVTPKYTYHMPLHLAEIEFETRLCTAHRNALQRARKDELQCELTTNYQDVKSLILKTLSRKNAKMDAALIDKILFQFANCENSFSFVTYQNEQPISTAFCIVDKQIVYYLLGGYDDKLKHNGAGILTLMKSMLHSKNLNKKTFDFEGSMMPEVEKYFRGFGAELVSNFKVTKSNAMLNRLIKVKSLIARQS